MAKNKGLDLPCHVYRNADCSTLKTFAIWKMKKRLRECRKKWLRTGELTRIDFALVQDKKEVLIIWEQTISYLSCKMIIANIYIL